VLGLIIFVSGVVVGASGSLLVLRSVVLDRIHHPDEITALVARRITRKLDLSDQQAGEVAAIVARRRESLRQLRAEVQPRFQAVLDAFREDIAALLTDDQAREWRSRVEELQGRWVPPVPAAAQPERRSE